MQKNLYIFEGRINMKIYTNVGYEEVKAEVKDLMEFRDRLEERGYSTSDVERRIDDLFEALHEFEETHEV